MSQQLTISNGHQSLTIQPGQQFYLNYWGDESIPCIYQYDGYIAHDIYKNRQIYSLGEIQTMFDLWQKNLTFTINPHNHSIEL